MIRSTKHKNPILFSFPLFISQFHSSKIFKKHLSAPQVHTQNKQIMCSIFVLCFCVYVVLASAMHSVVILSHCHFLPHLILHGHIILGRQVGACVPMMHVKVSLKVGRVRFFFVVREVNHFLFTFRSKWHGSGFLCSFVQVVCACVNEGFKCAIKRNVQR